MSLESILLNVVPWANAALCVALILLNARAYAGIRRNRLLGEHYIRALRIMAEAGEVRLMFDEHNLVVGVLRAGQNGRDRGREARRA